MVSTIGIIATILVTASLIWKTRTFKGAVLMRVLNALGSVAFIIYGFMLPALATGIANIACLIINLVYLFIEIYFHKKESKHE